MFTEIEIIVAGHIQAGTIDQPGAINWHPQSAVEDAKRKFREHPKLLRLALVQLQQQYQLISEAGSLKKERFRHMEITNLTPHDIVVRSDASNELVVLESDRIFSTAGRGFISTKSEQEIEPVDGIPCTEIEYGEIEGLPEPSSDTIYIVSMPAAQYLAAQGRSEDIRYPDTGKPAFCVRNEKNLPFATRRFLKAKVK